MMIGTRAQTWRNVPGVTSAEIGRINGGRVIDPRDDRPVPPEVAALLGRCNDAELVIDWHSDGYYDPGQYCGPPERCYPAERDEERTVTRATLRCDGGHARLVPDSVLPVIAGHWRDQIDAEELDPGDWRD